MSFLVHLISFGTDLHGDRDDLTPRRSRVNLFRFPLAKRGRPPTQGEGSRRRGVSVQIV